MKHKERIYYLLLLILPIIGGLIALSVGRYPVPITEVFRILSAPFLGADTSIPLAAHKIVWDIRLPRVLAALLIGAGLASSGAAFQGIFRNPLVSPYILGVASGAGFGAALAILLSGSIWAIQVTALAFGLLAVGATYGMSRVYKQSSTIVLVLSGVVVGAFCTSMISLIKYVADPFEKLPTIVFWLMGSLAAVEPQALWPVAIIDVVAMLILVFMGWRINILTMGDYEAKAFGVNVKIERGLIIFLCTLITAASTSIVGIIGWIGMVIPHIARLLVGPDNRKVIPVSIALGACYLLGIDTVARTISENEIPLGILTSSIGAPFFAYLLVSKKVRW